MYRTNLNTYLPIFFIFTISLFLYLMFRLSKAEWFKNDINVDYVIFLDRFESQRATKYRLVMK